MSEINKLTYAISLGIVLAVLWLLLSGHYTVLLVAFGIFSVTFAVFVALRMEVVDHESHPVHLRKRAIVGYW
ncbi:MAG TPA: cation transporter, partial [Gammaproteobacteria bacterium]|nr:cation transporter [Gammaproteobacteria bacterium]